MVGVAERRIVFRIEARLAERVDRLLHRAKRFAHRVIVRQADFGFLQATLGQHRQRFLLGCRELHALHAVGKLTSELFRHGQTHSALIDFQAPHQRHKRARAPQLVVTIFKFAGSTSSRRGTKVQPWASRWRSTRTSCSKRSFARWPRKVLCTRPS